MICTICKKREVFIKKRNLCSRCYGVEYRRNREKFKKNDFIRWKICKQCNKRFKVSTSQSSQRFCSQECTYKWKSTKWLKKNPKRKKYICKFCKIEFKSTVYQPNKFIGFFSTLYCSRKCSKLMPKAYKDDVAFFDTYAKQISYIEKIRREFNRPMVLQVTCTYCGKWYSPTRNQIRNRINALEGKQFYGWSEARFYCCDGCKEQCPVFNQKLFPRGFKEGSSREVQPELRQMVFERDGWVCQKCGSQEFLHCHHITGVELNPIESADIDNCVTFCKECHMEIHSQKDCRFYDLRRKAC